MPKSKPKRERRSNHIPSRDAPACDWEAIKDEVCTALTLKTHTMGQLAEKFGVKVNTLQAYSIRHNWPTPQNIRAATRKAASIAMEKAGVDWLKRGEEHREKAFALAHGALAKKKSLPIRNWRDAETADKMARRAAGLENESVVNQTLISINERINAGVDDEVLEAHPETTDAEFEPQPSLPEQAEPEPCAPDTEPALLP